ncbi:MAG: hypothetical protein ABWY27_05575 [Telluria sp.]
MTTTTIPFRPSASPRPFQLFAAVRATLIEVFQRPAVAKAGAAEANGDVWKLYRMARGTDSVSPAVIKKLSEVAASK